MGMITKDDRELINKLYDKFNKGERINSSELTSLYNRVLNKKENNTINTNDFEIRAVYVTPKEE